MQVAEISLLYDIIRYHAHNDIIRYLSKFPNDIIRYHLMQIFNFLNGLTGKGFQKNFSLLLLLLLANKTKISYRYHIISERELSESKFNKRKTCFSIGTIERGI